MSNYTAHTDRTLFSVPPTHLFLFLFFEKLIFLKESFFTPGSCDCDCEVQSAWKLRVETGKGVCEWAQGVKRYVWRIETSRAPFSLFFFPLTNAAKFAIGPPFQSPNRASSKPLLSPRRRRADMAVHHLLRRGVSSGSQIQPLRGLFLASQVPAAPPLTHCPRRHRGPWFRACFFPGGAGAWAAPVELCGGGRRSGWAEGRAGGRQAAAQGHLLPSHPGTVVLSRKLQL
jgi:hypothetical protein